jgi:predicted RNase H-like HicB family nuclease
MFLTVIETGPASFGAFAPDIQGCAAFSVSKDELKLLFKAAADAHLRELAKASEQMPVAETTEIPGLTIGVPSGAVTLEWTEVETPAVTKEQ